MAVNTIDKLQFLSLILIKILFTLEWYNAERVS